MWSYHFLTESPFLIILYSIFPRKKSHSGSNGLNVAEASALSVGVKLKLARTDRPKFDELVIELLLGDGEVNVTHQHVRLGLNEFAFLKIAADVLASNLRVVKLAGASASLIFIEELKEAVAILALGLLVHSDEGLIDVVSHLPHVLV